MSFKRTARITVILRTLESMRIDLEEYRDKKQDVYDNASEKWQESERGEQLETDLSELDEIVSDLESNYDRLTDLFEEI